MTLIDTVERTQSQVARLSSGVRELTSIIGRLVDRIDEMERKARVEAPVKGFKAGTITFESSLADLASAGFDFEGPIEYEDIVPNEDGGHTVGTSDRRWKKIYTDRIHVAEICPPRYRQPIRFEHGATIDWSGTEHINFPKNDDERRIQWT